jgi:hypothetical protein
MASCNLNYLILSAFFALSRALPSPTGNTMPAVRDDEPIAMVTMYSSGVCDGEEYSVYLIDYVNGTNYGCYPVPFDMASVRATEW